MELNPDFYEENPFDKEPFFRVAGAAAMTDEQLNELFVKNLIAFVYYQDCSVFLKDESLKVTTHPSNLSQLYFYNLYLGGSLLLETTSGSFSPVLAFGIFECRFFKKDFSRDALYYCSFIENNASVFYRIDVLAAQQVNENAGTQFLSYLTNYNAIYPHLNVTRIGNLLDHFFVEVCKSLCASYVFHQDESCFFVSDFEQSLQGIFIAMKYDLLDADEQVQLVELSKRWISQRFREFALVHRMQFAVHEMEGPLLFEPLLQYFTDYFSSFGATDSKKSFPTHIFSTDDGYSLFDTLANGLYVKASVSYVYRLLFEKGMIVAKDTLFRKWYNQQSYPIQLSTTTETLEKCKSADREQFVAIVAALLKVAL